MTAVLIALAALAASVMYATWITGWSIAEMTGQSQLPPRYERIVLSAGVILILDLIALAGALVHQAL